MLRPTLIVGIGTSGLQIVSEVQKLVYETFGVNQLPIFRYVYIETDTSKNHEDTPAGSDIIPIHITVQSLQQAYHVLSNDPQLSMDWISRDLPSQLAYNAQGAGGVRPAGRLLLWGGGNFSRAYGSLEDAWRDINNAASRAILDSDFPGLVQRAGGFDPNPVVYVVGTLVGGTCSGAFIDIGYMLRRITRMAESGPLYGIFVLPREGLNIPMGYGNCHGAVRELEFFRATENFYQEVWPNNVRVPPERLPPYAIVYLVSPEYGVARFAHMRLDGCLRVAALRLFCDLVGLTSLRGSVLADGMNEGYGFYATFGISAVLYPKYALMEAAGCAVGKTLCDRWLMGQSYMSATGETVVISEKEVFDEADRFVAEQLQRAFSTLSTTGASAGGLRYAIEEDIDRIIRKEEARPAQFLAGRFTAGKPGNYYSAVNDNLAASQDQLIQAIRDFVYEKIKATENLEYMERLLEQIGRSLRETLLYWDRCRIPTAANEWNDYVSVEVRNLLDRKYSWLAQKRNVLQDRAENLLVKLKMFSMRKVLNVVHSSLNRGNLATTDQSVALPTIERLREARKHMQEAREELQKREAAITDEVADTSVPIHRVWYSGSFAADRDNLRQAYSGRYGTPSLTDIAQEPPWEFLSKTDARQLFPRIKVGYQGRFRELLPAVNVIEEATQRVDLTREYAERALAGLLRLNLPAHSGHGVPRFVLGADSAALNTLVGRLRQQGLHDLQPGEPEGHVRRLSLLDHAVVFYEEKARINPTLMLAVGATLKHWFENPGVDATGVQITDPNIWKQQRLAYNVERRARVAQCQGLLDFILDFALIWERQPSDEWRAVGLRWKDFPVMLGTPPRFHYKEPVGTEREFDLETDPRRVRELAERRAHFDALFRAVVAQVRSVGEEELNRIYNEDVKPYLRARDADDVKRKTDFYFGSPDERNGLIHLFLSESRVS